MSKVNWDWRNGIVRVLDTRVRGSIPLSQNWNFPSWDKWCQRRWVRDFMEVQPK